MNPTQCPQCETEIPAGAEFCPACGVRQPGAPAAGAVAETRKRWGGTRVVVWFLAAAAIAGLLFLGGVLYFIRHTTIVTAGKNGGRMEAPFGVLSQSKNPAQLAHSLGLDIYPGASAVQGTEADLNHSVVVSFEFRSTAAPREIMNYYHVRYPDASVKAGPDRGMTLVQLNPRDTMTIVAEPAGQHTRILVNDIRH